MRRSLFALPVAAVLLAGCATEEPPQVTFAAGGASAVAKPAQYCDIQLTECTTDPAAPVTIPVPPGSSLQVTVPPEIAGTPWQVVFSYRDAAGTPTDERSPVFAPDERTEWTLALATPADRLLTAEVQQYGPPPQRNPETGEVEYPIRASWVLTVGG